MPEYTPGPWYARQAKSGEYLTHVVSLDAEPVDDEFYYGRNVAVGLSGEDARLIAAAPELLELAKLVAQDYEDAADWKDARGKLASMARAALDKAGMVEEDDDGYDPYWGAA